MSTQHPALRGYMPVYWPGVGPSKRVNTLWSGVRFDPNTGAFIGSSDSQYPLSENRASSGYYPNDEGVHAPIPANVPALVSHKGRTGARTYTQYWPHNQDNTQQTFSGGTGSAVLNATDIQCGADTWAYLQVSNDAPVAGEPFVVSFDCRWISGDDTFGIRAYSGADTDYIVLTDGVNHRVRIYGTATTGGATFRLGVETRDSFGGLGQSSVGVVVELTNIMWEKPYGRLDPSIPSPPITSGASVPLSEINNRSNATTVDPVTHYVSYALGPVITDPVRSVFNKLLHSNDITQNDTTSIGPGSSIDGPDTFTIGENSWCNFDFWETGQLPNLVVDTSYRVQFRLTRLSGTNLSGYSASNGVDTAEYTTIDGPNDTLYSFEFMPRAAVPPRLRMLFDNRVAQGGDGGGPTQYQISDIAVTQGTELTEFVYTDGFARGETFDTDNTHFSVDPTTGIVTINAGGGNPYPLAVLLMAQHVTATNRDLYSNNFTQSTYDQHLTYSAGGPSPIAGKPWTIIEALATGVSQTREQITITPGALCAVRLLIRKQSVPEPCRINPMFPSGTVVNDLVLFDAQTGEFSNPSNPSGNLAYERDDLDDYWLVRVFTQQPQADSSQFRFNFDVFVSASTTGFLEIAQREMMTGLSMDQIRRLPLIPTDGAEETVASASQSWPNNVFAQGQTGAYAFSLIWQPHYQRDFVGEKNVVTVANNTEHVLNTTPDAGGTLKSQANLSSAMLTIGAGSPSDVLVVAALYSVETGEMEVFADSAFSGVQSFFGYTVDDLLRLFKLLSLNNAAGELEMLFLGDSADWKPLRDALIAKHEDVQLRLSQPLVTDNWGNVLTDEDNAVLYMEV